MYQFLFIFAASLQRIKNEHSPRKTIRMTKCIALLLIFAGIISAPQAFAQSGSKSSSTTTIKGQVLDSLTNEAIAYATVWVSEKSDPKKVIKAFSTDDAGKFQIPVPGKGEFLLNVQFVGKTNLSVAFQITGKEKTIDLRKLLIHDNQTLGEVVVSAVKPLVQVDLDKITYSMEDDPDSKTNNVLEMMKKVPMITVDADDNIQLRGSSSYKIYLDGKPSNMISNNPGQVLKSMPTSMVKKIEVITDPGAKYDAEGVTGIINIITNKQPMGGYTGSVNAGANLYGYNLGGYLTAKYGKFGLTGNYNYNNSRTPVSSSSSSRESFFDTVNNYLTATNSSSNRGHYQYGSGEISYEIDTLNLISASFNLWGGNNASNSNSDSRMMDANQHPVYEYLMHANSKSSYGSSEINVNYQRTFSKKDELLTASYRLSLNPNDQTYTTKVDSILNYYAPSQQSASNADTKEHTFQLDYTTPIAKIHTIEAGVKYIIRISESDSYLNIFNPATHEWAPFHSYNDQFHHRQDILSAYGGYSVKYKKVGFKAGLRMENTKLNVEYPLDETKNFDNGYFNLIPSATFSYQYKKVHNFRIGYNLRIQRPGISYLNPYVNDADPKNISYGNPDLDVEKSHNFNLNYGVFKPKFNLNANVYYNFVNNSIERVTTLNNDVSQTTYENIGKSKNTGLYFYGSWSPIMKLRIFVNAFVSYTDIQANNGSGLKNAGFTGQGYGGAQYNFPLNWTLSFNGGASAPRINLQGKSSGFHYTTLSLNKSFMKKKLTVSLSAQNVFEKYIYYHSSTQTDQFRTVSNYSYPTRNFRIGISYKFGEMKQQIKKVQRGINNDDSKSGQSESGNSGGGGTQ